MKKVLVNKPIHDDAMEYLSQSVEVVTTYNKPASEVLGMMPGMNGIILCAGLTLDEAAMGYCSTLEIIGRHGAGLDIVDVDAATKRGIPVVFTPYGPTESTAEHAFLLMMAAARKLTYLDRETRAGNFHVRDRVVGKELRQAKVGIVGFGRIGQRFAEMCRNALEMEIYVYDPFLNEMQVKEWGAIYVNELTELAGLVDVVSIHSPLNSDTKQLINRDVLNAMKPDGILVNASRGALVDEKALMEVLRNEKIGGAGLDVYDPEPPDPKNPLFALNNVVLTPHLASFTDEGRRRMGMTVAEDILRVLEGKMPKFIANPEVLKTII